MTMATTLTGPKTLMWHQQMRGEAMRGKPMAPTALRLSVCVCVFVFASVRVLVNPLTLTHTHTHTRSKRKSPEFGKQSVVNSISK